MLAWSSLPAGCISEMACSHALSAHHHTSYTAHRCKESHREQSALSAAHTHSQTVNIDTSNTNMKPAERSDHL